MAPFFWQLKNFDQHTKWQLDGDHIFLSPPSLWGTERSRRGFAIFLLSQAPSNGSDENGSHLVARTKSILFAIDLRQLNLVATDGSPFNGVEWIWLGQTNLVVIWWNFIFLFFFFLPHHLGFSSLFKNLSPPCFTYFLVSFIPIPPFFSVFFLCPHLLFFLLSSPFCFFFTTLWLITFFCFFFPFSSIFALCFFPSFFVPTPQFSFFLLLAFFFSLYLILPIFSPCSYCLFFLFFPNSSIFFFFTSHCCYCHFMPLPPMPFWATEKIWLPFNIPPLSYGNQKNLVAQEVKCEMNFLFPNDSTYLDPF